MKRFVVVLAVLAAVSLACAEEPVRIDWITRWDDAVAEARAQHKPILVDFWADWCTHCVKMDHVVWSRADVAEAVRGAIPFKAYFEKGNAFATRFNVDVVPWVLLVDADGHVLASMRGYQGATEIKRVIAANAALPPAD